MSSAMLCSHALLPDGWSEKVRLQLDESGRIETVEKGARATAKDQVIDGPVIPGMPNAHSHAFQYALVGLTHHRGEQTDSFWTWREAMYGLVAKLDIERLARITTMAYRDMLCAGYTHVCEFHYLHRLSDKEGSGDAAEAKATALQLAAAAQDTGIGLTLLPVLYQQAGFGQASPEAHQQPFILATDEYLQLVTDLQTEVAEQGIRAVGYAPHSMRAVSLADLQRVSAAANASESVLHLHISEQTAEVEDCIAAHGARPFELLCRQHLPGGNWNLVHGTHMDDGERAQAVVHNANLVICPGTEADLGDGYFPLDEWIEAGGTWSIGSDSNSLVDPATELRMLEYQQRLRHRQRNVLGDPEQNTGSRLWQQAARGGGVAAGLPLGRIAEGYRADLVELDCNHPRLAGLPPAEMLDAWLFSNSRGAVNRVWIAGMERVRGGRLLDLEKHRRIAAEFRNTMGQILSGQGSD